LLEKIRPKKRGDFSKRRNILLSRKSKKAEYYTVSKLKKKDQKPKGIEHARIKVNIGHLAPIRPYGLSAY
jgi:hypothetical protein